MVLPETEVTEPTKAGGRVKGVDSKVSELLRLEDVVNPTGSVTTDWASLKEAKSAQPNRIEQAKISRGEEVRWDIWRRWASSSAEPADLMKSIAELPSMCSGSNLWVQDNSQGLFRSETGTVA